MNVSQPLFDPAMTEALFEVFKDTLEASVRKALADSPTGASSSGTELKSKERLNAADLRIALLMGKIPDDSSLLIDTQTFAHLLSVSSRTLKRLVDLKAVPAPIHLGRLVRWRLTEVLEWIEASCPPQKSWTSKNIDAVDRRKK